MSKKSLHDHEKAVESVLSDLSKQGANTQRIREEADSIMRQLELLGITLKRHVRS